MITYKLLRMKNGKLYPLYVEADRELPIGEWLNAQIGPKADETHVKARIGGGQLSGKGLNNSTFESVKNGNFLSQEQTDMIFAVVGEELGFTGSAFIILLYLLFFIEGLRIAGRSPDEEGRILGGGLIAMMAFQCFVNMGVAMLVLPNTGTPLPFISAGMSSLLSCFMMTGILLNIGMQRRMKIL